MRYDCSFFLCRMNRTVPSLCRVCPHPIVYCNDHSIIVLLITINVLTTITPLGQECHSTRRDDLRVFGPVAHTRQRAAYARAVRFELDCGSCTTVHLTPADMYTTRISEHLTPVHATSCTQYDVFSMQISGSRLGEGRRAPKAPSGASASAVARSASCR